MQEPTELDKLRAEYVRQIYDCAHSQEFQDDEDRKGFIDHLLLEWGAKAYRQGQEHLAQRVTKYVGEHLPKST